MSIAIRLGNTLRIAVLPTCQIDFDNSSFGGIVLTAVIVCLIQIVLAIAVYSFALLAINGMIYVRKAGFSFTGASLRGYSSKEYLAAKLGCFVLGYAEHSSH